MWEPFSWQEITQVVPGQGTWIRGGILFESWLRRRLCEVCRKQVRHVHEEFERRFVWQTRGRPGVGQGCCEMKRFKTQQEGCWRIGAMLSPRVCMFMYDAVT